MVGMKSVRTRTSLLDRTIPWPMIPATVISLTPRVKSASGRYLNSLEIEETRLLLVTVLVALCLAGAWPRFIPASVVALFRILMDEIMHSSLTETTVF